MAMCFTQYMLDKKHQLSKIWLAAHWEKRIKRTQIFEVDIERSIQEMMDAEVQSLLLCVCGVNSVQLNSGQMVAPRAAKFGMEIILDLRISGHLLVGIVKIHAKKCKYLLSECSSIFDQIKIFRCCTIDLPQNKQTAAIDDITLTELFDSFEDVSNDVLDAILSSNQSRVEDITLKEVNERLTLFDENDMKDYVFNEDEMCANFEENFLPLHEIPDDILALFKKQETLSVSNQPKNRRHLSITTVENIVSLDICYNKDISDLNNLNSEPLDKNSNASAERVASACIEIGDTNDCESMNNLDILSTLSNSEDTALLNLDPLMISKKNFSKSKEPRKRKLGVDYKKTLSYDVIMKHVQDTSSITTMLELAPTSKRLMILKQIGCAEMLLQLPVMKLQNPKLLELYNQNLKTQESDDFELPPEEVSIECERPRKKSRSDSLIEIGYSSENFDVTPIPNAKSSVNFAIHNDTPALDEDLMMDTELVNGISDPVFDSEALNRLSSELAFSNNIQVDDASNVQSTQLSKTSQERWEYALQDRIVQMIKHLKQLFQQKSALHFSSLVDNNKRIVVAQKFFCLLMLKKYEVICLEQLDDFGEVVITQGLNFDSAYIKFCDS